jgi:HrpA-like RNA helicase
VNTIYTYLKNLFTLTKIFSRKSSRNVGRVFIHRIRLTHDFFCIFREDILAFLTGQEEIETTAHNLRTVLQATDRPCPKGIVVPLYAAQQVSVQQKVFTPTKEGCRKIILSTNIAETSLTIPGVKHVIDSCRVKAK